MPRNMKALGIASLVTLFIASTIAIAHGEGEDTGSWRDLFGAFDIMVSASFLHSIGAILLVGGLLHIHSRLKAASPDDEDGDGDEDEAIDAIIGGELSNRLIYVGVVMNMIGGTARLFEPGHPSLLETFANRWVTIMLVKHSFILIMCGAAIYATLPKGTTAARLLSTRMALASVVVIGALGALAGVVGPA